MQLPLPLAMAFNWYLPSAAYMCQRIVSVFDSDSDLSPLRHQAIHWTNAGLSIVPLWAIFSEILIKIQNSLLMVAVSSSGDTLMGLCGLILICFRL